MLAVRSDVATASLYSRTNDTLWSAFGSQPESNLEGAWDLIVLDNHYLMLTSTGTSNELTWNSISKDASHHNNSTWSSLAFGYLAAGSQTGAVVDANGTIHLS